MKVYQGRVACKVVVGSVNPEVRVGNGGTRHVQRVNNLLKVRGGTIGRDLIGKNGERIDEGKKSKNALHI